MILMRTPKMMVNTEDKNRIKQLKGEGWVEFVPEMTKEDYFKILDEKKIEYKKSYGLTKLKELAEE